MNPIEDSIDALIENIKVSEHYAENQRKQLLNMEIEMKQIKIEISSMKVEKGKVNEEIKGIVSELSEKEALLFSLEKEMKILSNIHKDMKQLNEKEEKVLNEKQQNVWKKRELFCNIFHQISEELGFIGTSWLREPNCGLKIKRNNPELEDKEYELCKNVKKLEEDLRKAKIAESEAEQKLTEAKLMKDKLTRDPDFGEEFTQLQTQLKKVQSEIEQLENQPEHTREQQRSKQLLNRKWKQQTLHLMPLSNSQTTQRKNYMETYDKIQNSHSAENSVQNMSMKQKESLKRPVASISPAMKNFGINENSVEECYLPPKSKKPCTFVPKKPTSVGKNCLSQSNNWKQLQDELSALLKKDVMNNSK